MNHYDTLGVNKDATPEEVRKAYRAKASENHPDKGGDGAKMQLVNAAYATLGDQERRAQYDATGDDRADSIDSEAQNCAMGALMQHLERSGALGLARSGLRDRKGNLKLLQDSHKRKIEKFTARRDKFKVKDGHRNLAHLLIDQAILQLNEQIQAIERELTVLDKALALLDEHGEELPPPPVMPDLPTDWTARARAELQRQRPPFGDYWTTPG